MQTIFICPRTEAALRFEIPADEAELPALWTRPVKINCPVCQAVHMMDYKHAFMAGVMAEFECIPADVKQGRVH